MRTIDWCGPEGFEPSTNGSRVLVAETAVGFSYFFRTAKNKGLGVSAKPLINLLSLVGGAGFEPATPAV
jgi:hypothetical protein